MAASGTGNKLSHRIVTIYIRVKKSDMTDADKGECFKCLKDIEQLFQEEHATHPDS